MEGVRISSTLNFVVTFILSAETGLVDGIPDPETISTEWFSSPGWLDAGAVRR